MISFLRFDEDDDLSLHSRLNQCWTSNQPFIVAPHSLGDATVELLRSINRNQEAVSGTAFAVATSGSTGEPRLYFGDRNRARALVQTLHVVQRSDPVTETLGILPLSYSFALVNQWLWATEFGRRYVPTNGFKYPEILAKQLLNTKSAMLCLVASQVPLIKRFFGNRKFPGVIRVHFAGERFPQKELPYIAEVFPNATVFNNYGCTEAMPRLTCRLSDDSEDSENVGQPIPGVRLRLGLDGALLFRSKYSAVATLSDNGAQRISDNEWIPSGDYAVQNSDGSWSISGRTNQVFKRHGVKVSVQAVLSHLENVWTGQLSQYSLYDTDSSISYALVVSPEPSPEQLRSILRALRDHFSRAHWPLRIESLSSIPTLASGKIDSQELISSNNKKLHWRQRI